MKKMHYLIEEGHRKATWTSELEANSDNNSGAHKNSQEFVKADSGSADENMNGYGMMEDHSVPGNRDIQVDWNSVDSKLGAQVNFEAKADV